MAWNQCVVGDMNAFPHIVYAYYTLKIAAYLWLFYFWLANPAAPLLAEDNVKRFLWGGTHTVLRRSGFPWHRTIGPLSCIWHPCHVPGPTRNK